MADQNEFAVRGPAWLGELMATFPHPWCLLRDAPDAPADDADLDLLVAPTGLQHLEANLRQRGFGRLVRPGRGSHRFWARYDRATDSWPKVDIVTRLCYGPHQELCTNLGRDVLQRRTASASGIWGPAPDDAFWLLILHGLLDKGTVLERHRDRLRTLASVARASGPAAGVLASLGLLDASPPHLLADVLGERWDLLARRVPQLRAALQRRDWPRAQATALLHRVQRRAMRQGIWPLATGITVEVRGGNAERRRSLIDGLRSSLPVETRQLRRPGRQRGPSELRHRWRARIAARGGCIAFVDSTAPATPSQPPVPDGGADLVIFVDGDPTLEPHDLVLGHHLDRIWSRYVERGQPREQ